MIIETKTPQETFDVGKKIGENAKPGQIYTLTGDLGVGKNCVYSGRCSRTRDYRGYLQSDIHDHSGI